MRYRLVDEQSKDKLLSSDDYRKFLRILIEDSNVNRGEQAKLSRKAGFSSRSYLSEILAGKKGLSRDSASRLKSALQLPRFWGSYFDCLVWLEHPELSPKNVHPENIKSKLAQLRTDIGNTTNNDLLEKKVGQFLQKPQVFQIYAALGTAACGAVISDVVQRTNLSQPLIEKTLRLMIESGVVIKKGRRYFAEVSKADALNFKNKAELSELIRLITTDLNKKREVIANSATSLTVYSAFSVHSSKRLALKERLQEAVFEVMDEFQDDSGDHVEQIFLNLFHEV